MGVPVAALQSARALPEDSLCVVAIDFYTIKSEMQDRAYQMGFKKLIPLAEAE